ncbi:MAG: hypothetical protein DDT34_02447 [Firmicutes bacterium]|nr:hypothetical protein [Bacillota bacterium]
MSAMILRRAYRDEDDIVLSTVLNCFSPNCCLNVRARSPKLRWRRDLVFDEDSVYLLLRSIPNFLLQPPHLGVLKDDSGVLCGDPHGHLFSSLLLWFDDDLSVLALGGLLQGLKGPV